MHIEKAAKERNPNPLLFEGINTEMTSPIS